MNNKQTMDYWTKIAKNNPKAVSVKVNSINDFTSIDANFILKFITKNTELLDLASGSGLIINKIQPFVKSITAVEKFNEFSKFIHRANNIEVINEDIVKYTPSTKFDLITMFGIVQYFSTDEIVKIYDKFYPYLKDNGKLIIKNQFGIKDDVLIAGYSEEIGTEYFSNYRMLSKEIQILEKTGFIKIDTFDIYPPKFNRWQNTHFYAIVCEK